MNKLIDMIDSKNRAAAVEADSPKCFADTFCPHFAVLREGDKLLFVQDLDPYTFCYYNKSLCTNSTVSIVMKANANSHLK